MAVRVQTRFQVSLSKSSRLGPNETDAADVNSIGLSKSLLSELVICEKVILDAGRNTFFQQSLETALPSVRNFTLGEFRCAERRLAPVTETQAS